MTWEEFKQTKQGRKAISLLHAYITVSGVENEEEITEGIEDLMASTYYSGQKDGKQAA